MKFILDVNAKQVVCNECIIYVQCNTVKRLCIKTLPPVLCIQLKRFDYDWESNRAIKFDDHFKVSRLFF
jgi:ubiquitin C-terminal hydrolase